LREKNRGGKKRGREKKEGVKGKGYEYLINNFHTTLFHFRTEGGEKKNQREKGKKGNKSISPFASYLQKKRKKRGGGEKGPASMSKRVSHDLLKRGGKIQKRRRYL